MRTYSRLYLLEICYPQRMIRSIPIRATRLNWPIVRKKFAIGRKSDNARSRRCPKPSRNYHFMREKSLPFIDCHLSINRLPCQALRHYPAPLLGFSAPTSLHGDPATEKTCRPFMIIITKSRQHQCPPKGTRPIRPARRRARERDRNWRMRGQTCAFRNLEPDKS